MDILLSIPLVLSSPILDEWVVFVDVVHVDSSFCCSRREEFLRLISSILFRPRGVESGFSARMVKWLLIRNVRVSTLQYHPRSSGQIVKYLKKNPKCINEVVQCSEKSSQLCIGELCPNLRKFEGYWSMVDQIWCFSGLLELRLHSADERILTSPFTKLQVLSIGRCRSSCLETVEKLVHKACLTLQKVSLPWTQNAFSVNVLSQCHGLRSVRFQARGVFDMGYVARECQYICNLDLTDSHVLGVAQNLKQLRSISLRRCHSLTNNSLISLQHYCADSLEVLYLENDKMTGGLPYAQFPNLKMYRWIICSTYAEWEGIVNMMMLSYDHTDARKLHTISAQFATSLETLVMTGDKIFKLNPDTFVTLTQNCPHLRTVHVSCAEHYALISELVQDQPQLRVTMQKPETEYDVLSMPV